MVAVLNSPVMWWHNWRYLVHMKDEALNPAREKMVDVPIPRPHSAQSEQVAGAVLLLGDLTRRVDDAVTAMLDVLRVEYQVETPGQALEDFPSLGSDAFVMEVKKRRVKRSARLSPAGLTDLRSLFDGETAPVLAKRARILGLEQEVASAVHEAYGLDASEIAMLRETAPPRMPPGW